ncbi:MAG: NAD(P)H-dependent glycerol-3-phosphate dehydrogenase [Bacteroidales bacterium]|nr:NAD(P)H-dependent glycerol-3-phosphate dehydrogenase [Bacteroidales bacterium]
MENKIAVIGSGSWATAIVKILLENNDSINWWVREPEIVDNIKKFHHNPLFLSSVEINSEKVNISTDLKKIITGSTHLIFVVPAAFLAVSLKDLPEEIFKNKKIISAIKGIVPEHNLIIGDFFNKIYGVSFQDFAVISGPSHAEEIALEKLTYLTASSQNTGLAGEISEFFNCRYLKTTLSDDIYGTEYSAVLKNIISVAVGVCKGLGYGDNFQAVLISNGLQEIKRFIDEVHPIDRDLSSSVYLGDLIVTTYSQFSRNRTFGTMLGSGYSVKSAQLEMKMIAEGYYATKSIKEINKTYKVEMPITEAVYNILYENIAPAVEMKLLADRLS